MGGVGSQQTKLVASQFVVSTLLQTNISPSQGTFEDDFPFPQVGYVSSLEGSAFSGPFKVNIYILYTSPLGLLHEFHFPCQGGPRKVHCH